MPHNIHIVAGNIIDLHHCPMSQVGQGMAFWHHDAICIVINSKPDVCDELLCMSLNNNEQFHLHRDFKVPPVHLSITAVPYQKRGGVPSAGPRADEYATWAEQQTSPLWGGA